MTMMREPSSREMASRGGVQPERNVIEGAAAAELEGRLRRAVEVGRAEDAQSILIELEGLAAGSQSRLVVTTYLLCVVRGAALVARNEAADVLALARDVIGVVEPWFSRDVEDFVEVAEGGRHAALHALMHVAAETGKFDQALAIRNLDNAGNRRCGMRWASEGIASTPGCHALYPNAYGHAQLIGHLVEAGRYEAVPGLLDGLAALTGQTSGIEAETLDAVGEEEVGALDAVLSFKAPAALIERCKARRAEVVELAQPASAWPRTWARLGV
jgi:hypothetical protein